MWTGMIPDRLLGRGGRRMAVVVLLGCIWAAPVAANFDPESWKVRQSRLVLRAADVELPSGTVTVEVYSEPEHQTWGREVQQWAVRLLPQLVERFGPWPGDTLLIVEEPQLPGPGWNGLAAGIRLRYPAGPAELARQLVHTWIHPGTVAPEWLHAGVAVWEGLQALRGLETGAAAEAGFGEHWRIGRSQWTELDFPLAEGLRGGEAQYRFGLAKATLFVALMHAAMGERGYTGWVRGLPNRSAYALPQLKTDLRNLGRDPDALLAGWVEPGAYRERRWSDLADTDRDGWPDALETLTGTRPDNPDSDGDGLSDGFEYWHGLNPASRDSLGDGRGDARRVGVAVDGLGDDWERLGLRPAFRDFPPGDGDPVDIRAVWVTADAANVYFRIDTAQPVPEDLAYWLSLHIDLTGDRRAELLIAADERGQTWHARTGRGQSTPGVEAPDPRIRKHANRVIEMAVPRDLIDRPRFRFSLRLDRPGGGENIDSIGGYWHPVDVHVLTQP